MAPRDPFKHPRDPIHLHDAARRLGDLVGSDQMSDESASCVIGNVVPLATNVDHSGLRARLHWRMRDQAAAVARARANAMMAVRWAVRPLFMATATVAAIEEAAGKAGGDVLEWRKEIVPILRDEMQRELRRRGRAR